MLWLKEMSFFSDMPINQLYLSVEGNGKYSTKYLKKMQHSFTVPLLPFETEPRENFTSRHYKTDRFKWPFTKHSGRWFLKWQCCHPSYLNLPAFNFIIFKGQIKEASSVYPGNRLSWSGSTIELGPR